MPDEHAEFSPSASERWLKCPASVPLSEGKTNGDTIHTVRGTAMHNLAEKFLLDWTAIGYIEHDHGDIATLLNGETVLITAEEWRQHVVPYIKAVRADFNRWKEQDLDPKLLIEKRVTIAGARCWGSCDAAVVVPGWYIGNYDLKTGAGKIVDANNPQNLSYLAGLAAEYDWDFIEYKAHISQNGNVYDDNIDGYTTSERELKSHLKEIKRAIKSSETAKPGPIGPHCQWCPSKTECPAQREAVIAIFNEGEEPENPKQEIQAVAGAMTDTKFLWVVEHLGAMRQFLDAVEDDATKRLLMGEELPGFKVVQSNTKRRWKQEKSVREMAAELELYGVEEALVEQEPKLITIGNAEKQIGKNQIEMLTEKPEGKPILAPEGDKRPAIPIFEAIE